MTKISLPTILGNAIAKGEDLETRILRTSSALSAAQDRDERASSELLQTEMERDALAGARDLAAAAESMGERPDVDTAELKKQIAAVEKRLGSARVEADNARSAVRGLELRLTREKAELPAIMQAIEAGQGEARLVLLSAAQEACADLTREIAARLGPIAAAESGINGWEVRHALKKLDMPLWTEGRRSLQEEIQAVSAPSEFQRAGAVAQRLSRGFGSEA